MLFRGPYLKVHTWKQSLLQLIQEVRNHIEMYRPGNISLSDIPSARVVAIRSNGTVALADANGNYPYVDGVSEEILPSSGYGRVRYSGFVRVQLVPAQAPSAGDPVFLSNTIGLGTLALEGVMFARVYDNSSYAVDETVIVRLTCCAGGDR